tara:strand:- start:76 stop:717 length:642 start_codon:yes stop_codon:yes gene_type:complete
MSKRKFDILQGNFNNLLNADFDCNKSKLYHRHSNNLNLDTILLLDNHIYFDAVVNNESIQYLILYINLIVNNSRLIDNQSIILHINTKGGFIKDLIEFLTFKQSLNYEIISVIDKECYDCGIMLAAICDFRIINKNAKCFLTKISDNPYFWNYFQQCNNDINEIVQLKQIIYDILCNKINSKLNPHKLDNYFSEGCTWDAKKYRKLGLADEII